MTDWRIRVVCAGWRFGGIDAPFAMYVVKVFCFCVVRLEVLIVDRPRGRNPSVMADLAEVFLS